MVPVPITLSTACNSVIENLDGSFQFFLLHGELRRYLHRAFGCCRSRPHRGCRTARPHLGERWSSRLVAAASTDCLSQLKNPLSQSSSFRSPEGRLFNARLRINGRASDPRPVRPRAAANCLKAARVASRGRSNSEKQLASATNFLELKAAFQTVLCYCSKSKNRATATRYIDTFYPPEWLSKNAQVIRTYEQPLVLAA
jgi:hypothetical protein